MAQSFPKLTGSVGLLIWMGGCTSVPKTIPTGEWQGQGVYSIHNFEAPSATSQPDNVLPPNDNPYPTSMWIERENLFGHEALAVQIFSRHQEKNGVPGSVLITFHLIEIPPEKVIVQGSKDILSYAVLASKDKGNAPDPIAMSKIKMPERDEVDRALAGTTFPLAICIRTGKRLVLQIFYNTSSKAEMTMFKDTLVFEGDRLLKTGHFAGSLGVITWAEELRKVR